MRTPVTRVFTASDVRRLLDPDACIAAVEAAFQAYADGSAIAPGVLGTHVSGGGFHVKTAGLGGEHPRYAAKINANFPGNSARHGLPTIQGVLALCDAPTGACSRSWIQASSRPSAPPRPRQWRRGTSRVETAVPSRSSAADSRDGISSGHSGECCRFDGCWHRIGIPERPAPTRPRYRPMKASRSG